MSQLLILHTHFLLFTLTLNKRIFSHTCSREPVIETCFCLFLFSPLPQWKRFSFLKQRGIQGARLPMQHNSLSCFSHSVSYSHTPHYKVAAGIFRVSYKADVTCALSYFWWEVPFSAFSFQLCSQAARLCCGFVML